MDAASFVVCSLVWDLQSNTFPKMRCSSLDDVPVDLSSFKQKLTEGNPFRPLVFTSRSGFILPGRGVQVPAPVGRVSLQCAHELTTWLLYEDIFDPEHERGAVLYLYDLRSGVWSKLPSAPFHIWLHVAELEDRRLVIAASSKVWSFAGAWSEVRARVGGLDINMEGICGLEASGDDLLVLRRGDSNLETLRLAHDGTLLYVHGHPDLPSFGPLETLKHGWPPRSFPTRALFGRQDMLEDFESKSDCELCVPFTARICLPVRDSHLGGLDFELVCGHYPEVGMSALEHKRGAGPCVSTLFLHVAGTNVAVTVKFPEPVYAYHYAPKQAFVTSRALFFLFERRQIFRYDLASREWTALPRVSQNPYVLGDFDAILETPDGDVFTGHLDRIRHLAKGGREWRNLPDLTGQHWHVVSLFLFSGRLFAVCTDVTNERGHFAILVSLSLDPEASVWVWHCELGLGLSAANGKPLACMAKSNQ
jgi:hypothetical protein